MLAHVASISPTQHPWLYGDFGRRVFDGRGDHARLGFGIVRRGPTYDIDAGTLLGVTPGAVLAVERSAPGQGAAEPTLIGRVQVASATRLGAVATSVTEAFDVPPDAHARVEVPGADGQLLLALAAVDPEMTARLGAAPFLRIVPSGEAEVWLSAAPDGSHVVRDDAHDGGAAGEPALVVVPARARARVPAVLAHCARYRAPLRLARACTDLPGQLDVTLLSCDDAVWSDALDPQNPALPEVPSRTGTYPYWLRDGDRYCIRVRNRSSHRLYVTVLNAAASGCVEYLGDAPIGGGGLHTFWLDGALGDPFEASVTTGRPVGLDRIVVIGTTEAGRSLRFLEEKLRFADILDPPPEVTRNLVLRTPPAAWTSQVTAILIDAGVGAAR
jgi:hypothetical protein